MRREPAAPAALAAELDTARGGDRRYERFVDRLMAALGKGDEEEGAARRLVERMALALQAALLIRHAPAAVADAFCAARLEGERGMGFGTLPSGVDLDSIIERARPLPA
jgi:putative acyl-CoA dehydrogenase